MTDEVTLSSLSGEELLSILRQSLAKKKEAKDDPIVRSSSATTLIEDEIIQPLPIEKKSDEVESEKNDVYEEDEDGIIDEVVEPCPEQITEIPQEPTVPEITLPDTNLNPDEGDDLGFSPDEFLRDVLSHPPSVAEPATSFLNAKNAYTLGKLSAFLSYDSSFQSFYSNLNSRLENLKKEASEKKVAWQDAKEKYRVLREDVDKAIKKMEVTSLEYKDAEQDKVVLESVMDWIMRVKDKSVLKSEAAVKDLGSFGRSIPSSWNELIGVQALTYIENYNSSTEGANRSSFTSDVDKNITPNLESRSKDSPSHKMAVFSRLGSKDNKPSVDEVCANFNKNCCSSNSDSCKKLHICLYCGGPHPVTSCGPSKATERILCVQWNVDERKCRDHSCPREHRCIRCISKGHTVIKCNAPGASKAVIRPYCYLWNASSVNYCHTRDCRRVHGCLRCGKKTHGALSCPDNVETYYKDSCIIVSQKRSRSTDREPRREVRGRVDT